MDPIVLIPVGAAMIAFGGAYIGARVNRGATRYSARLQALQRMRDTEIDILREYGDALLEATIQVQSYTFAVPQEERVQNTISAENWPERRAAVEPALLAVQRAEFLAAGLPWPNVVAAHKAAHELLMAALVPTGDGRDAWDEGIDEDENVLVKALDAVSAERRRLLENYPVDVPKNRSVGKRIGRAT
ncbi:hypothetical protein [Rhodococcus sp. BS-15]|uniref:hypothetical protein n=1 Tax=Rhodococcus sp. BS-15 TaxID=1304954 RepID=UPI0011AE3B58|nr:hypothetical protein [Rhodococcus sp. BS-15]